MGISSMKTGSMKRSLLVGNAAFIPFDPEAARALFAGGAEPTKNSISYVTIATTGNAVDFGDLTVARRYLGAAASSLRGVFAGGYNGSDNTNVIDYITIASTGNATDFGDLTLVAQGLAGCSNAHGGL
jgi:hypothetical protein